MNENYPTPQELSKRIEDLAKRIRSLERIQRELVEVLEESFTHHGHWGKFALRILLRLIP